MFFACTLGHSRFLVALNKLHAHFVLPELHQELIRNFNIELLFGLAESRPIELGGHFNQVITAEEKVSLTSCFTALFEWMAKKPSFCELMDTLVTSTRGTSDLICPDF